MGSSAAERQRRSRAHRKGDHRLCLPGRCPDVTVDVTDGVTSANVTPDPPPDPVPADLGDRGRRVYREVLDEHPKLGARERLVLEEAARTADRCEHLDRILRGDERVWARIRVPDTGEQVDLVVDKTLAEARQQQSTLARLLSELRQHLAPAAKETQAPPAPPQPQPGGGIADLTARIAARRGGATPAG